MPDAPDWERQIVAPGGGAIAITGGLNTYTMYKAMGMVAVTMDPFWNNGSYSFGTTGRVNFAAFNAISSATVKTIYTAIGGTASCTANENFLCIYDYGQTTAATFTLLGHTAAGAIDAGLDTAGLLTATLSTSVSLVAGQPYAIGFIYNGATPSLKGCNPSSSNLLQPLGVTQPTFVESTTTGHTTAPGSIAFSATTGLSDSVWFMVGP